MPRKGAATAPVAAPGSPCLLLTRVDRRRGTDRAGSANAVCECRLALVPVSAVLDLTSGQEQGPLAQRRIFRLGNCGLGRACNRKVLASGWYGRRPRVPEPFP